MQFVVLARLWWMEDHEHPQPTQAQLAQQAGIDPMMTSQVVRKLELRGLIERHADENDTRARKLRLTAAGRALLTGALADVEHADARYFEALGDRLPGLLAALAALERGSS